MNKSIERGFTLIELIAAIAVLSIIVVLLLNVMGQMLRLRQTAQSITDRLEKGGGALDMMRRDLWGAQLPVDPTHLNSLQFLLSPPAPMVPAQFSNPGTIFWQAPIAANTTHGDLAIVGYFIRWDESDPGNPKARLCRLEIDPNDVNNYNIDSGGEWLSHEILDAKAFASAPGYPGLVAEDVVGLWVRALFDGGTSEYTYDSRVSGGKLPNAVEVALVVLDSSAAKSLTSIPQTTLSVASSFDDDIQKFVDSLPPRAKQGARIFRTVIPLNNHRYHK